MRHASMRVLEPRYATWLAAEVMLQDSEIGRVAADPAVIETGALPDALSLLDLYSQHFQA